MGLESLLSRLENRAVTSVTSAHNSNVTQNPLPAVACTPVTCVTSENNKCNASEKIESRGVRVWCFALEGKSVYAIDYEKRDRAAMLRDMQIKFGADRVQQLIQIENLASIKGKAQ